MAHNSLRRELSAALDAIKHSPAPELDCAWAARLFNRCLNALGGPVVDARILEGEIVKDEAPGLGDITDDGGFLVNGVHPDPMYPSIDTPADDVDHDLIRLGSDGH